MATLVLIASPTIAFGELIRLTLEGEGNYHATRVGTACEALALCQSTPFSLAVLDADLSDLPLSDLFTAVQKLRPGIRLIVVPPNSDPKHPLVADLPAHGFLNKPFYLPDLMNIVTHALATQSQPPVPSTTAEQPRASSLDIPTQPTPPRKTAPAVDGESLKRPVPKPIAPTAPAWLQDVARAAQHLTRLSLETAALAALIIRDGQLWAYAGQLSQPAAQELAQTVAHYWARGNGSDLARFVHLDATDGDYMLYATAVSGDMALAVVFDIEMPFSKIRSQASHLARSLASPPGSVPPPARENAPIPPTATDMDAEPPEGEEALDLARLTPLFDDVPPALPGQPQPVLAPGLPRLAAPDPAFPAAPLPVAPEALLAPRLDALPAEPHAAPSDITMTETAHPSAPVESPQAALEPASLAVCQLSYAGLLVPRMPQHTISGDLAERLPGWTRQLCLAYGWRLDRLVVNPDYVAWVMHVPPTASPSMMMRIFRQQTSARIFADFPTLVRDNPSGDFWAPGYFVMSSGQLPPETVAKDFLKQTRRRQGVP